LSVPIHLTLKSLHRSGDGSELTFQTISPEGQHGHLAGLVMTTATSVISAGIAAKGRKHLDLESPH